MASRELTFQWHADITLYRDDLSTIGPQPVVQSTDIDFAVDDRDLVVVDDVLYTGRTIRAAMNGFSTWGGRNGFDCAC